MDPVSVMGVLGSVVNMVDVVTRSLKAVRSLQQKWKMADMTVTLLLGHMATLKAALNQISDWISSNLRPMPQHHQLVMDLGMSLDSCKALVAFMHSHLIYLELNHAGSLTLQSRVRAILQNQSMKDCLNHLGHQANALNLLLTALNW